VQDLEPDAGGQLHAGGGHPRARGRRSAAVRQLVLQASAPVIAAMLG
jgi:hypothetical protein